jgi:DNA-binding transcriptional MerR regulator
LEALKTPAEAAELLGGVSVDTLRDWRYRGTGPAYVRVGQQVRYDLRDLERYRDAQRVEAARGA